ncbi:CopG family transcriptional regulator [bacterium]|nr:CopG family transcriptional regulator [bacterium]
MSAQRTARSYEDAGSRAKDEHQNITLSLPADMLSGLRHIAIERGMSLSDYVAELMENLVDREEKYRAAMKRSLKLMKKGFNLGLNEQIPWTRDELHERD